MRIRMLIVAAAWAATTGPVMAQTPARPTPVAAGAALTLDEAWRLAEQANPALRRKLAQQAAVEGAVQDAGALLFNNPQITWEATRRDVPQAGLPDERRKEWSAGISQTLEIAGQRGHRVAAADAMRSAQAAELEGMRRDVRAVVAQQFYRVLALQQRVAIETQALSLFEQTAAAVTKRRAAGEDTKLDANVAAVEAERARSQRDAALEQLIDARSELAVSLQYAPAQSVEVTGELTHDLDRPIPPLDRLQSSLLAQPRLRALAAQADGARARLDLERASRVPDLTVGLSVGREGATDARERLTTLSLSVPLPLFRRNAAGVGQAGTELTQAQIDHETGLRDAEAGVRTLRAKLQSLQLRIQRLQGVVAPTLADNVLLSQKSQRAGQIGLLEYIVVSRQALDAQRDLIDALLDFQNTRLTLAQTAGLPLRAEEGIQE